MLYWLKIIVMALISTYFIFVVVELSIARYYNWMAKKYQWSLVQFLYWKRLIFSYTMYNRFCCRKPEVTDDDMVGIPHTPWKLWLLRKPEHFITSKEKCAILLDYANSENSKLTERLMHIFRDVYPEDYDTWKKFDDYILISDMMEEAFVKTKAQVRE